MAALKPEDGMIYTHHGGLYIFFKGESNGELHFRITSYGSCHKAAVDWYKEDVSTYLGNSTELFKALFEQLMGDKK